MNRILLYLLVLFSIPLFSQSWEPKASLLSGRHHPISFSLNGKGYAATGTASNNQPTSDFFEYNPLTDTWRSMANFPGTARSFGIGTVANGKAYLGFGAINSQYLRDFWSYEPSDSSWTQLANCSCTGRRHPAMISIGNKIYVGLGDDASGDRNDWWMYDITSNTWTQISNLPGQGRHHPFMFNAGGEVFAGLGHSGGVIYRDWYKLDTTSNSWSPMRLFPGEARVAGTQFALNGYGYVLSGDGDNHNYMPTGEMWRYNPSTDSWEQLPPHPGESRWAPGSFVIDEEVYFFGGLNRLTTVFPQSVWKFDLADTTSRIRENQQILANTVVYPNPANDFISWKNDASITEVKMYNVMGQQFASAIAEVQEMDVSKLSEGLYLVQFYDRSKLVKTSKVLIQH